MFTSADLRDDVEADLRDSSNATWSTAQIDRAIALALEQYSRASPHQASEDLASQSGRTIDLTDLTDYDELVAVRAVEYPAGANATYPKSFPRFSVFGSTLSLQVDAALASETVTIYYDRVHFLHASTAASSTVPDRDRALLATGAAAFALDQLPAERQATINLQPDNIDDLRRLASDRHAIFTEGLTRLRHRSRNRRRQLFRPYEPAPGQDVVDWPS